MDNSLLLTELRRIVECSDKDFAKLIPLFDRLDVKKSEHLFQSGEIAKNVYFIQKGCMRQYYINTSGDERTIYFKVEKLHTKHNEFCISNSLKHIRQPNTFCH